MRRNAIAVSLFTLIASLGTAQARVVTVQDGFESGNSGNWVATGDVMLMPQVDAKAPIQPNRGKGFVFLANPMPFPGTSLTNSITLNARKGDSCSLELRVLMPGKTGALAISVQDATPVGPVLVERKIDAPATRITKGQKGYRTVTLPFKHGGAPLFVSIHALGPVEAAIDDFAITCRTR